MSGLYDELAHAMAAVTDAHRQLLLDRGVRPGNLPLCGITRIRTEADGFYVPDCIGSAAAILPIVDDRQVVDLLAFRTSRPEQWWTRRCACSLLGGDALLDLWLGQRLRLHRHPLSWLSGTDPAGVVVLQWGPAVAHLANVPIIEVEDKAHAAEVRARLLSTIRLPTIEITAAPSATEAA